MPDDRGSSIPGPYIVAAVVAVGIAAGRTKVEAEALDNVPGFALVAGAPGGG
jgi:hypothetical protein